MSETAAAGKATNRKEKSQAQAPVAAHDAAGGAAALLSNLYSEGGISISQLSPTMVVMASLAFMILVISLHFIAVIFRIIF